MKTCNRPYTLAARESVPGGTVVSVGGVEIGVAGRPVMMAGPCAVESPRQLKSVARFLASLGVKVLRGGAFKPRTSPYSFQGLGLDGLKMLSEAARENGLLVVTEVMESSCIDMVAEVADILQIGSRNMQNFPLLRDVGAFGKPVLLKRGMSATIDELLCAAEYLMVHGCRDLILCERGIRTFESATRNTLDLSAVPLLKRLSHLPVIVDPSHACGRRDLVVPMSRAALAAGADGLLVETTEKPEEALCDGRQSLDFDEFRELMRNFDIISSAMGKV